MGTVGTLIFPFHSAFLLRVSFLFLIHISAVVAPDNVNRTANSTNPNIIQPHDTRRFLHFFLKLRSEGVQYKGEGQNERGTGITIHSALSISYGGCPTL